MGVSIRSSSRHFWNALNRCSLMRSNFRSCRRSLQIANMVPPIVSHYPVYAQKRASKEKAPRGLLRTGPLLSEALGDELKNFLSQIFIVRERLIGRHKLKDEAYGFERAHLGLRLSERRLPILVLAVLDLGGPFELADLASNAPRIDTRHCKSELKQGGELGAGERPFEILQSVGELLCFAFLGFLLGLCLLLPFRLLLRRLAVRSAVSKMLLALLIRADPKDRRDVASFRDDSFDSKIAAFLFVGEARKRPEVLHSGTKP